MKIAVIGLGYVGLPLAVEFGKKFQVVGFDIDEDRIGELKKNFDRTNELSHEELSSTIDNLLFTTSRTDLEDSNIYIVTVPTPVDKNNAPNLEPIINATRMIGSILKKNDLVIYESTVFPGCTEEICVPILQEFSNLTFNEEFFCGYSPERINPGDRNHRLADIMKITSGSNPEVSVFVDNLYSTIIKAGTFSASSMKVAEAAKVIENTQRDVNIALINELALIFKKLDIDTTEVLKAASTKWNFISLRPGLVGGHCIGVDPYYLTHKASEVGYHPEMILAGRRINDNMGYYLAETLVEQLAKSGKSSIGAKVCILGLTFKENCPDLRNTKVTTIIEKLTSHNCQLTIVDGVANKDDIEHQFGMKPEKLENINNQDAIIIAVSHREFINLSTEQVFSMLKPHGLLMDVKSIFKKNFFKGTKINYWRL